jgi:hypothetical protein
MQDGCSDTLEVVSSLPAKLDQARHACLAALAAVPHAAIIQRLPGAPSDAQGWFDLLSAYPQQPESVATIKRLKAKLQVGVSDGGGNLERYALLQALSVSLTKISASPVANSVKGCFVSTCNEIAANAPQWRPFYDESSIHFMEAAKLAVLQRYPAGDLVFAFYDRLPYAWALKICPWHLPGFVRQLLIVHRGIGPWVSPHINNGRPSHTLMLKARSLRSLWRIAKSLELNPDVKGLYAVSWFLSAEAGRVFPHIAWMRTMYTDEGAYAVDMEAAPGDSGLMVGSAQRQKLYEERKFNPRRSLVLWPREQLLAWAARHPELAGSEDDLVSEVALRGAKSSRSPPPVRSGRHNSRIHLWNGHKLLDVSPIRYVARVLLAPAFIAALVAATTVGWWAGLPAFALIFAAAWILQYYCFQ